MKMTYSLFYASKLHNFKQQHTESVSKMIPRLSKQGAFFRAHINTDKSCCEVFHVEASKALLSAHTHTQKYALKTGCFGHVELYMISVSRSIC